jgi:hypothetical protein
MVFLLRPSPSPDLASFSITEQQAWFFVAITRDVGALGRCSSVNSVQNHLTFPIRGSCSTLLFGKCNLFTARFGTVTFQNPLHAKENLAVQPHAFSIVVLPELQALSGAPSPPWWPSCWLAVVVKQAVVFLVLLIQPPQVCPWLDQVQQQVSLFFNRAASLAVELYLDGGAELWFAAYPGAAAAEFRVVPLPASAWSKPQPDGTCHSLRGLTLMTLLEAKVSLFSSDNR